MKPERLIDSTPTPGGDELFLYERDGVFTLRIGGIELMTSRAHDSEEELAWMAMKLVGRKRSPRVLVGGLGMGYTTRAALVRCHGPARSSSPSSSRPSSGGIEITSATSRATPWTIPG